MEIRHDNVIYISFISKLGGVESFCYYMVKKYRHLDICVVSKQIDITQLERLRKICPVYVHHGEDIYCKTMIINYDTSIIPYVKQGDIYMTVHADYTQSCYTKLPDWYNPRIKKVFGITQYICDTLKEKYKLDCELNYNPLVLEEEAPRITLVSATRLSAIKGGKRMKRLADALDLAGVNYVWYVFTNDNDCINSNNVIFLKPRLDVWKWIKEADYLVQLSDTEGLSYAINEALAYGTKVIVTPLPYLESIGINNTNALILDFDLKNIHEVVRDITKVERVKWEIPQDHYYKYLFQGKSKYEELKSTMKKIRVKQKFLDMAHNNTLRKVGDEIIEDGARADDLISRGFCVLVEDLDKEVKAVKPKVEKAVAEVETAVKEVKKEKAVKEKAVKKNVAKK